MGRLAVDPPTPSNDSAAGPHPSFPQNLAPRPVSCSDGAMRQPLVVCLAFALCAVAFSGCDTMGYYKPPAEPDGRTLPEKIGQQSKEIGEGIAGGLLSGLLDHPWGFQTSIGK